MVPLALPWGECQRCRAYGSAGPQRQWVGGSTAWKHLNEAKFFAPRPAPEHEHRDDGEAEGKAEPDAAAGERSLEGKPCADANANGPIAEGSEEHRHAGVMEAAKDRGADYLRAISQLEHRGDQQELDGERQNSRAFGLAHVEEQAG